MNITSLVVSLVSQNIKYTCMHFASACRFWTFCWQLSVDCFRYPLGVWGWGSFPLNDGILAVGWGCRISLKTLSLLWPTEIGSCSFLPYTLFYLIKLVIWTHWNMCCGSFACFVMVLPQRIPLMLPPNCHSILFLHRYEISVFDHIWFASMGFLSCIYAVDSCVRP